jgi:DNA-binding beta-propeller fold protein YncE
LLTSLGQDVFVPTNGAAKVVRLLSGGGRVEVGPAREGFFAAAVNANDRVFVTNRLFGDVTKINANTNSVQGTPAELPNKPYAIAINPPKNRVYIVAAEVDLLYVLDGASLEIVGSVPLRSQGAVEGGQGIAVLGNRIYVGNFQDETVTVLDDSACP